jgi:3-hydroxymyristoyl/3-hydroxydecanoyl-(acyl carrier protein) dehydratase
MTTSTEIVIACDHPAFAGHFPGEPIVPGVVLLDEALHAIATISGAASARCSLGSVKFLRIVRPGQPVTLSFGDDGMQAVSFELRSLGELVATGTVTFAAACGPADGH